MRTESKINYLAPEDIDALARMLNALLIEHWIMRDRLAVLEELLAQERILESEAVDRYVPSGDFAFRLETLRDTIFSKVLDAPFSNDTRTVEDLVRRKP